MTVADREGEGGPGIPQSSHAAIYMTFHYN